MEEYGVTSFRRTDKSEPALVVPFCDFSLATHFLFFKRSNGAFSCAARSAIKLKEKVLLEKDAIARRSAAPGRPNHLTLAAQRHVLAVLRLAEEYVQAPDPMCLLR